MADARTSWTDAPQSIARSTASVRWVAVHEPRKASAPGYPVPIVDHRAAAAAFRAARRG
jgi:hypothetical protein